MVAQNLSLKSTPERSTCRALDMTQKQAQRASASQLRKGGATSHVSSDNQDTSTQALRCCCC